jgi:hydroxymethylbilane synthase
MLALAQAEQVKRLLQERCPELEVDIRVIRTAGDEDRTSPLSHFGGQGAFVRAIESALLMEEIDIGVHSLKDLPSRLPEGLALGAAPVREDPRDALVSRERLTLYNIPRGGSVATGSERRRIQLAALRPDLVFLPVRGNIETRIRKIETEGLDGVVLACAGLKRLGLASLIAQVFPPEEVLPAPCQGALGLECRADDNHMRGLLRGIENEDVRVCVDAERAFIAELGLGCHAPVAALAVLEDGIVHFAGLASGVTESVERRTITAPRDRAAAAARELALEMREALA